MSSIVTNSPREYQEDGFRLRRLRRIAPRAGVIYAYMLDRSQYGVPIADNVDESREVSTNMQTPSLQELSCCMGMPVAGNPTQYMMEQAYAKAGLDWRYITFEVGADKIADAMKGFRALGFRGGNFTIPHKQTVIEHCDELTEAAQLIGAVNCIVRDGDKLIGNNTDGRGFVESLGTVTDIAQKRYVVLGAGGAARAIAVELALGDANHITIVNRTVKRGEELARHLAENTPTQADFVAWEGELVVPEGTDVLINATSIGLNDPDARVPLRSESMHEAMIVADVVFNPPQTQFLEEATGRGCKTLDGLGMLVNQGAIGFKLWTSVDPDTTVMRDAIEEFLGV